MKVAVSAYGQDLSAEINPRFGRCEYLLIVDTDSMGYESFPNESMNLSGGAGIQTASFVVEQGARAVLTGSVGPKAMEVFKAHNVDVYPGQDGTVAEAVARFKEGGLHRTTEAVVPEKNGMNFGPLQDPTGGTAKPAMGGMGSGRGMGGGGGRGMGGGGGRGMGGGCGRGMGGGGRGMGGCGRGRRG